VNEGIYKDALLAALLVGAALLIAFQGVMLWWTRKTVGRVPKVIVVLRVTNIVLLVLGVALVIWRLAVS
jgi:F0F1-type ATP synthase membrane subunit c/vacuolar-type H+-ATPase subunit K